MRWDEMSAKSVHVRVRVRVRVHVRMRVRVRVHVTLVCLRHLFRSTAVANLKFISNKTFCPPDVRNMF